MKKGAAEALRKHREDIAAGTEQLPEDPQLYWARMRPICATRLADVPADMPSLVMQTWSEESSSSVTWIR